MKMTTKEQIWDIVYNADEHFGRIDYEKLSEEIYTLHKRKMIEFAEWINKNFTFTVNGWSRNGSFSLQRYITAQLFDLFEQENNK